MRINSLYFFLFLICQAPMLAQPNLKQEQLNAQTLSPLRASVNQIGDRFTLLVVSPSHYKDCMVEGEITEATAADKSGEQSKLSFAFDKMAFTNGTVIAIQAVLLQMANSKGKVGMDDDGQSLTQKSIPKGDSNKEEPKKRGNVFSRFGKTVAKGAKDLAHKIAGGMTVAFTSQGKDIHFEPGSIFTLSVSTVTTEAHSKSNKSRTIESP